MPAPQPTYVSFQHNQNSTNESTVYGSAPGLQTIITQIILTNTTSSPVSYSLSHVPNGGAAGDGNRLLKDVSIPADDHYKLNLMLVMAPGDFISIRQGTGGAIVATGYGYTEETS